MFGSNILDIGIGVIFLFLLLSLICSAANEMAEGLLKKRASELEKGIKELLGSDATEAFIAKIYNHGLVNGLYRGTYGADKKPQLPSYIPSRNFALALISISRDPISNPTLPKNVQSALDAFEKVAQNDAAQLQKSVEDWYNSSMDRVSGWYKRRSQNILFILGLLIAFLINADCINYAKRLSSDTSLRQSVVAMAEASAKNEPKDDHAAPVEKIKADIKSLDVIGLPIGWKNDEWSGRLPEWTAVRAHFFGWLLTALAVSFGAPFWFDILNKVMVVRSTVKPHEKSKEEPSKDASQDKKLTA